MKIYRLLVILILTLLIPTQSLAIDKNIIAGNTPTETAIEISKNWTNAQAIVLVNSEAKSDILCATVLASQINSPILLTEEDQISSITYEEINRLQPKTIYLIGGLDVISQNIETQLQQNTSIQRISGKDRYQTSLEVATTINSLNKTKSAIIVNGHYSATDTISIAPVAGNKNIPIIISKHQDLEEGKTWLENNNIETTYIIGGENVISENIEKQVSNPQRIGGNNRYETNAKVIEEFYNTKDIENLFYCRGNEEQVIEGMIATPFLATTNSPIVLVGNNLSTYQKEVLTKKNINNLIQIGYGVKEEVKEELNKLKKNTGQTGDNNTGENKPPTDETKPPIDEGTGDNSTGENKPPTDETKPPTDETKPPTDETKPPIDETKPPIDEECPKLIQTKVDDNKKIVTLVFNEEINTNTSKLKENITIEIEGKIIKLNKYDKATIKEKELIIELEDGLIGTNNNITINPNTITDNNKNNITEPIELKDLSGLGKRIAFVKDDKQLETYLKTQNQIEIIKLENDIQLTSFTKLGVILENIVIDGSNGENNYKLEGVNKSIYYELNLSRGNITLKNLDMNYISIYVSGVKNIKLKNIKMNVTKDKTPSITLEQSSAEGIDLYLQNKYAGILLASSLSSRSNFIVNGLVQNTNGPAIILTNPITTPPSTNLNTVSSGINIKDLNELYNIEIKNDDKQEYKIYTNRSTY